MNHQPATPLPWVSYEQGEADEYCLLTSDRLTDLLNDLREGP